MNIEDKSQSNNPSANCTVPRELLNKRFLDNLHRKLTLVEAPAGYGKTTLMREWFSQLEQSGETVIWVQIGVDAVQTLAVEEQILLTLSSLKPSLDAQFTELNQTFDIDGRAVLPSILGILTSVDRKTFLFFDDAHERTPVEAEFLLKLILLSDDRVHIIIGTRETLGIPLTKLRLDERITDFGVEDLRFSRSEVEILLSDTVPQEKIDVFFEYSEGWIAALQLLRQAGEAGQILELDLHKDWGGRSGIAQYLSEHFFEQLNAQQQAFLIDTAHLRTINGDLADYIRQCSGSWEMLVSFSGTHSLVFEVTGPVPGYRYHQLLRDFLQKRQVSLGEIAVRNLNMRTAEWCFKHDRLVSAVRHAIAAKDSDRAVEMILQAGGVKIGMRQGAPRLAACLDQIPINLIHHTPRLIIARAYLLLKNARLEEAVLYLDEAHQAVDHADEEARRELVMVEAHQRLYEDQHLSEAQLASLEYTLRTTPVKDETMRGLFANFLCIFEMQAGNLEKARNYGDTAMAIFRDLNVVHLQFFMYLQLSVVDLEWGNYEAAFRKRKKALDLAQTVFKHDPALCALAEIYFSEIAYEMGEYDGLETSLTRALEQASRAEGWSEAYLSGYETCLKVSFKTHGFEAAIEHIADAETTAIRRASLRFARQLRILELELALDAGNGTQVDRLVAQINSMLNTRDETDKLRWRGRILARQALARSEFLYGNLAKSLALLEESAEECRERKLNRYLLRTEILRTIVASKAEHWALACRSLKLVLKLCHTRFPGAFERNKDAFAQAARDCVHNTGLAEYSRDETRNLAEILWICTGHKPKENYTLLAELLTTREYSVMRLISRGDANKVIARELDLSEATVKFHLKNIFAKLGVNNRKLVAEIAKIHGIR